MLHPRSSGIVVIAASCAACSLNTSGIEDNPWTGASSASASASDGTGVGGGASSLASTGGGSGSSATGPGAGGTGGKGGSSSSGAGGATGCGEGVEDPATKHCYLYAESASWADARGQCQAGFFGDLAAVSSAAELTFVIGAFGNMTDMYIGGEDTTKMGGWTWVNGEVWGEAGWGAMPNVLPWKAMEPNAIGTETVIKLKNGLFETTKPDGAKAYLCERAP